MSATALTRPGLNASEAAIAWAYARFGGDPQACEVLGGDAGRAVRAVIDSPLQLDDAERRRLVERWRDEDRRWDRLEALAERLDPDVVERAQVKMSPRWRRALERIRHKGGRRAPWHDNSVRTRRAIVWLALGELRTSVRAERPELRATEGFGVALLVDMDPSSRERFIRELGVFQLAELARNQDRRSLVRLRRALRGEDRAWFDECMRQERDVDRRERARLRELFLAVSRQEPDLTARLAHLGLYSVAAACGQRFAVELAGVAARLPSTLETLVMHYHRLDAQAASSLAPMFRRALDLFVERRAAATQSNTEEEPDD